MFVVIKDLEPKPRWTPPQAVAYAKGQVTKPDQDFSGMCDHFVTWCYGYAGSGYADAASHWQQIPTKYRHARDRRVPAGALVFWGGGSAGHGHVAISLGDGRIASNDIHITGRISLVPLGEIELRWGLPYLGWADPYMAAAWGLNPNTPPQALRPSQHKRISRLQKIRAAARKAAQKARAAIARTTHRIRQIRGVKK